MEERCIILAPGEGVKEVVAYCDNLNLACEWINKIEEESA